MYLAIKGCELRVCRNPAVVVAVLHSAFSRHEELVLRKVEKVFGGRLAANERLPFLTLAMIHPTCLHLCTKLLSKARKGDAIHPKKSALFTIY